VGTAFATEIAGSTRSASAGARRFWLWPNLLSLDAPLVAVLWQLLFLRCFHAPVEPVPIFLLAVTVWLIYAADRALDAYSGELRTPRHRFYREHGRALLPVWVALLAIAGWLSLTWLPPPLLRSGFLLLGAVAFYFVAVHCAPARVRRAWPKEAAVGALFALGASLGAWRNIRTRADAAAILLLSCLCWMNCAAIERWEKRAWEIRAPAFMQRVSAPHAGAKWPLGVIAFGIAVATLPVFVERRPVLAGAEMASALGFLLLDRARRRLSPDALRVLADVALLSPLLFLPIAGHV
jgi:hypothetical protein